MKVITHIACEIEPNNPEQGKILVEMDRYEFQSLTSHGRHEGPDGRAMGIVSLPTTHNAASPGGATIEVDGVRYAEVGPAKPKDWRPPVGATFHLRTDISDARGCLQQALKSLDAFYLIEPKREDAKAKGQRAHKLFEEVYPIAREMMAMGLPTAEFIRDTLVMGKDVRTAIFDTLKRSKNPVDAAVGEAGDFADLGFERFVARSPADKDAADAVSKVYKHAMGPTLKETLDKLSPTSADALGYLFRGLDLAEKLGDPELKDRLMTGKSPGPMDITAEHMAVLAEVTKDAIEHGTGIFETAVHIDKKGDIQFSVNRVTPPGEPLKVDLAASAASAKDFSAKIGKAALKKPRKPAKKAQAKKKAPARKARR